MLPGNQFSATADTQQSWLSTAGVKFIYLESTWYLRWDVHVLLIAGFSSSVMLLGMLVLKVSAACNINEIIEQPTGEKAAALAAMAAEERAAALAAMPPEEKAALGSVMDDEEKAAAPVTMDDKEKETVQASVDITALAGADAEQFFVPLQVLQTQYIGAISLLAFSVVVAPVLTILYYYNSNLYAGCAETYAWVTAIYLVDAPVVEW